ncbi:phosphotransferase [Variovorax sp. ZS18.2.2]|uniref:phosphotransferase n=1 Tax=Variovorax sp. ZS18.2.2 TaxID=2971255 RepID=UPI002151F9B5|nr:phosphotransferase [Variovorax sp. ZS18.2.2]MCR6479028.1 phosphotransferase [Variovorax sp. ZS18.2.2]
MTAEAGFDDEVLSEGSPALDADWVRSLALRHYGIEGEMRPLTGERDRNYRFESARTGERFMLKISHPSETPLVADFQTQALLHIAATDPELPVQRIVPTRDGLPSFSSDPGDGLPRVTRLFSYLPGTPMPDAPRTSTQQLNLARTLARLDLALRGFEHPAGALALPWDIQRADSVRGLLRHIADPERRALAERSLDRFGRDAKPVLAGLRTQPIHNDFNIYNVLVDPGDTDRIAGVLDFGDMVRAPLIDDLAVAAAYQLDPAGDALAGIVPFVAAYHAVLPLTREEVNVLFTLITARLVMVVAISGWRAARQPDNAAYLLRNNPLSWARLQACDRIGNDAASAAFRRACGMNQSHEHA